MGSSNFNKLDYGAILQKELENFESIAKLGVVSPHYFNNLAVHSTIKSYIDEEKFESEFDKLDALFNYYKFELNTSSFKLRM